MRTSHLYPRPSLANALLVQGHTRDPQPGNQSPRRSLALWAVVTSDLRIRRCRAQSNNVTPVNIYNEQPPHYFLILLSVALVIYLP